MRTGSRLAGLGCAVLNAKNDAEEAAIVAEAGAYGAITVSTQMAGRGTDIRLGGRGGDDGRVAALGGLYVIGTGRHCEQQARQSAARAVRPPGRPRQLGVLRQHGGRAGRRITPRTPIRPAT